MLVNGVEEENGGGDDVEVVFEEQDEDVEFDDMSQFTFSRHTASVFCVAISHTEKYCLSGGEDDTAYIWNTENPDEYAKIEGHKDSVTHCGFSPGDSYFFTADMSGYIQLFKPEGSTTPAKVWDFEVGDVEWVKWHSLVPILMAGTSDGAVWMWKVPSFETKTIQLGSVPVVDGTLLSTNRHLATAYQDGCVKVIDMKQGVSTFSVDTKSELTCVAVGAQDKLIAVGDANAQVHLVGGGKVLATLSDRAPDTVNGEGTDSVEHVIFHPSRDLLAAAYVGERVVLYDTALQRVRTSLEHPAGVIKTAWAGENDRHLVTACLDGVIRVWDVDRAEILTEVTGHTGQLLDITLSENVVLTSSDDKTVKVFKV